MSSVPIRIQRVGGGGEQSGKDRLFFVLENIKCRSIGKYFCNDGTKCGEANLQL